MINIIGVGEVIINSDINRAGRLFLVPIEDAVRRSVPKEKHLIPQIRFSALNGYAGSLGAAILALQRACGIP